MITRMRAEYIRRSGSLAGGPDRNLSAPLLIMLASLVAGVWMWCAGSGGTGWADDFPYSRMPMPGGSEQDFFDCKGAPLTSPLSLPQAWAEHYRTVNGRAANMLAFACLMLPLPLAAALHAVSFALLLLAMMRLSFGIGWRRHTLALACMVAAVWIILPWHEQMASQDFFINYVWSCALSLSWFSLLLLPPGRPRPVAFCLLGAAAAMMHEGIGVAMCAGLILLLPRLRGYRLTAAVIYMAASLVPLCSPGIWDLAGRRGAAEYAYNFFNYVVGIRLLPVWCAIALSLWCAVRHRRVSREDAALWVIIITGIAIGVFSHQGGRAFWLPLTLSIILVARCLHPRLLGAVKISLTCLIVAAGTLWGLWLCSWQYYASRERDRVLAQINAGATIIYDDLLQPDSLPWALMHTVAYVNGDQTYRSNMVASACGDASRPIALLPRSWHNVTSPVLPRINGSAGARGQAYIFLTTSPMREAIYTHDTGAEGSVALNPLYALKSRLSGACVQKVQLECVAVGGKLYACRPIVYARSLLGLPVTRIDTVSYR